MAGRICAAVTALLAAVLAGCGVADGAESAAPTPYAPLSAAPTSSYAPLSAATPATPPTSTPPTSTPPTSAAPETPAATESLIAAAPAAEPRRSWLSIPAIGVAGVPVVRYRGSPDDGPGTRIQNRGPAASPRGPGGGVGPGEVGNYLVTGHRTTERAPFRDLPDVREGDHVLVWTGDTVYDYVVTTTRRVSFRSQRSMARQTAAVPGQPGAVAVDPMITLSTCATPEDHAAGNYWVGPLRQPGAPHRQGRCADRGPRRVASSGGGLG